MTSTLSSSNVAPQKNLEAIKREFEQRLEEKMSSLSPQNELTQACHYAITTGGKRWRPLLVLLFGQALQQEMSEALWEAAIAVEMFHTASLIADDLPSMDNDDFRRGKETTHKKFGEAVAIMASYTLISEGYSALYRAAQSATQLEINQAQMRGLLAVESVAHNAGLQGATGGQFYDLKEQELTQEKLLMIHRQKTASIFEISMVLGWLFGGGELTKLANVQELAMEFGTAFQLVDDLKDALSDAKSDHEANFAQVFGAELTREYVVKMLSNCKKLLGQLGLANQELGMILAMLEERAANS